MGRGLVLGLLCAGSLACSDPDEPKADGGAGRSSSAGTTSNVAGTGPGNGGSGSSSAAVVELFQHCDYGGWAVGLDVGDYSAADLAALGAPDNDASSLRVSQGYEAVLYDDDGLSGDSVTVRADASCTVALGFNDRASSITVRAATEPDPNTGNGGTSGSGGSGGGGMPGSGGSLGGSADDYQACVDRINAFRATVGLPPYARDASSESCADGQAQSDSETGEAHGAFGDCGEWAQNECPGWGSIEDTIDGCLQSMWDEGPGGGHYDNMTGDYSEVFCGFYTTPDGKVWALQNFR